MKGVTQQPGNQTAAWQAAAEYGCDMALLERNLKMTPAQRAEAHRQALALVRVLRRVKVVRRG